MTLSLWLLEALWAALLFGGFLFGKPHDDAAYRMPTATRMASSLVLVVASAVAAWLAHRAPAPLASAMTGVALGMTLGFIGDLALAGWLGRASSTLTGMAAFGGGHLCYIAALWHVAQPLALGNATAWIASFVIWAVVAVVGWYAVVWRGSDATVLHRAALPYALLLASTAAMATAVAVQWSAAWSVALGAAMFLISDLVLAGRLFGGLSFPLIGDVVWLLYGPGQALIVFGMAALLLGGG
ncbi:MAG: hypothetical protein KDD73_03140 [Anaerolineales bacterium]|nr:hypothetical protein [Anaerolineales bacterium]MCB9127306.1 lysoplasmalogenase [Ardenticatenales bacterium]MCB9172595.1 lysoplasmalogenase [Ardenticatenales bacterium]